MESRPTCRLHLLPSNRAYPPLVPDTLPASRRNSYIACHTRSSSGIPRAGIAKRGLGVRRACTKKLVNEREKKKKEERKVGSALGGEGRWRMCSHRVARTAQHPRSSSAAKMPEDCQKHPLTSADHLRRRQEVEARRPASAHAAVPPWSAGFRPIRWRQRPPSRPWHPRGRPGTRPDWSDRAKAR